MRGWRKGHPAYTGYTEKALLAGVISAEPWRVRKSQSVECMSKG